MENYFSNLDQENVWKQIEYQKCKLQSEYETCLRSFKDVAVDQRKCAELDLTKTTEKLYNTWLVILEDFKLKEMAISDLNKKAGQEIDILEVNRFVGEAMDLADEIKIQIKNHVNLYHETIAESDSKFQFNDSEHKLRIGQFEDRVAEQKKKLNKKCPVLVEQYANVLQSDKEIIQHNVLIDKNKAEVDLKSIEEAHELQIRELQKLHENEKRAFVKEHDLKIEQARKDYDKKMMNIRAGILEKEGTLPVVQLQLQNTIIDLRRRHEHIKSLDQKMTQKESKLAGEINSLELALNKKGKLIAEEVKYLDEDSESLVNKKKDLELKHRQLQLSQKRTYFDMAEMLFNEYNKKCMELQGTENKLCPLFGTQPKVGFVLDSTSPKSFNKSDVTIASALEKPTAYEPALYSEWPIIIQMLKRYEKALKLKISLQEEL